MKTTMNPSGMRSDGDHRNEQQLKRDRIVGFTVLVVMLLLFALLIWLAVVNGEVQTFDYWLEPL